MHSGKSAAQEKMLDEFYTWNPSTMGIGHDLGRILLAEDDEHTRELVFWLLIREGYQVAQYSDGIQAVDSLGYFSHAAPRQFFDLIICELRLPGVTGLEIIELSQETKKITPIMLFTECGNEEINERALVLGAAAVLNKPFSDKYFLTKVREILPQ